MIYQQIIGNGIDILEIDRIKKILEKKTDKFIKKIFNPYELDIIQELLSNISLPGKFNYLTRYISNRFAAKESVIKSIGTGFVSEISFQDITITKNNLGKPIVKISDNLKKLTFEYNNININSEINFHLTMSDQPKYSVASTILVVNNINYR